jgi:modification methylase
MPEAHWPRPNTDDPALSVWATAQACARDQRAGRYLPASLRHPGKMLPALAAHAIACHSQPGDMVLDPMCGIGTTLVEAVHQGRNAIGVEYEAGWAALARANLTLAATQHAPGHGRVISGDARHLTRLVDPAIAGKVALVVTSPPYGPSTHGHARATRDTGQPGVRKRDHRYSRDPANLAHVGLHRLMAGFATILAECAGMLRPDGIIIVTARPWRHHGELVDLPSAILDAGQQAGLVPVQRCVALLAGLRGQGLIPRASFFQLHNVRQARAAGVPQHLIAHEDVLLFRPVGNCLGSEELKRLPLESDRSKRPVGRTEAEPRDAAA